MSNLDLDFRELDGFMFGKEAALADWRFRKEQKEFAQLVDKLRSRKWKREHRPRCNDLKRESNARLLAADPERLRSRRRRAQAKWRAKNPEKTREAQRREAAAAKAKDPAKYKAAALARARAQYQRALADPAKLEALRAYKREWARAKASRART